MEMLGFEMEDYKLKEWKITCVVHPGLVFKKWHMQQCKLKLKFNLITLLLSTILGMHYVA